MYQMPKEQLNTILQYLLTRPYGEVFQLVEYLKTAEPVMEIINE